MLPEERLKELGIELSDAPAPLGSYIPVLSTGNIIFISGMLPLRGGKLTNQGRVGEDVSLEKAKEDARVATVNGLSALRAHIGSLDKVKRCVKITGYVASAPHFIDQSSVLNAASDLLFEIFGEVGRHVRSAVGVSVLPLINSPLEIELIFEVSQ